MEVSVKIKGVEHKVQAELIGTELWVHHAGRTFNVDTQSGRKSRKKAAGGKSNQILAPMPGKITKLLLNPETVVQAGQAVLVMEAMKMEYTLKSDIEGVIESIHCEVGDQVTLGKVLVKLKAKADT
ncbi:acyl-CoA carboxylase subunit alpha [Bdellovibrio bacteriovorus W]|nr:acyl-CoA carboxylase subunit alpha [Bdellovibrio bacteriovorus W]